MEGILKIEMVLTATTKRRATAAVVLLMHTFALAACSKPAFEFRGYAADASCDAIIAAETSQGADLVGTRQDDIPGLGAVTVSELRGEVFAAPMFIDVVCHGGSKPSGILPWSTTSKHRQLRSSA